MMILISIAALDMSENSQRSHSRIYIPRGQREQGPHASLAQNKSKFHLMSTTCIFKCITNYPRTVSSWNSVNHFSHVAKLSHDHLHFSTQDELSPTRSRFCMNVCLCASVCRSVFCPQTPLLTPKFRLSSLDELKAGKARPPGWLELGASWLHPMHSI